MNLSDELQNDISKVNKIESELSLSLKKRHEKVNKGLNISSVNFQII
jgi:hypothetical protein